MSCCATAGRTRCHARNLRRCCHHCTCAGLSIPATATAVPVRRIKGTRLASAQPSAESGCAAMRTSGPDCRNASTDSSDREVGISQ
jgi:hypothetical protein